MAKPVTDEELDDLARRLPERAKNRIRLEWYLEALALQRRQFTLTEIAARLGISRDRVIKLLEPKW